MNEVWKPIKGFEGLYEVSNMGRVKSLDRAYNLPIEYFPGGKALKKGRIISGNKGDKHYQQVALFDRQGKKKYASIHRLVAEAFIPNPEGKKQVNHIDGNKQNNNVSNLEWVTPSENIIHSYNTGLNTHYGEKSPRSKLTHEQVCEIRNTYIKGRRGYGWKALADKYGVSKRTIGSIITGTTWRRDEA